MQDIVVLSREVYNMGWIDLNGTPVQKSFHFLSFAKLVSSHHLVVLTQGA